MRTRKLTVPQMLFIAGTRGLLGAGVALLTSQRMSKWQKRGAGITLALVGVATTLPAARMAFRKPTLRERLSFAR